MKTASEIRKLKKENKMPLMDKLTCPFWGFKYPKHKPAKVVFPDPLLPSRPTDRQSSNDKERSE